DRRLTINGPPSKIYGVRDILRGPAGCVLLCPDATRRPTAWRRPDLGVVGPFPTTRFGPAKPSVLFPGSRWGHLAVLVSCPLWCPAEGPFAERPPSVAIVASFG